MTIRNQDENPLPPISRELIASLDSRFPERCPDVNTEERVIWFYSGQRALVRFLIDQFARQNEIGTEK